MTDTAPAAKPAPAAHPAPAGAVAAPAVNPVPTAAARAAFSAGWLVAQLYSPVLDLRPGNRTPLPTVNELGRTARVKLILDQLDHLLSDPLTDAVAPLQHRAPITTDELRAAGDPKDAASIPALRTAIAAFHVVLLSRLVVADRRLGTAYSLGRSLSDTCWIARDQNDFVHKFGKYRLANLQSWLGDVAPSLPPESASAVSQGLDHWAAWLAAHQPLADWAAVRPAIARATHAQGEQWRALLAGEKDPKSLLTPEGYVAAGEAALKRASTIVRRAAAHFWFPLTLLVLVTAGAIAVALRYTSGATKLWGSAVSLAAGFGVTGKSLQATAKKLADEATQPLLSLAETDAISWAATCLPDLGDGPLKKRQLRKLGVPPPAPDVAKAYDSLDRWNEPQATGQPLATGAAPKG